MVNSQIFGLLLYTFIILKILNVIKWKWYWVVSPAIIYFVVSIVSYIIQIDGYGIG